MYFCTAKCTSLFPKTKDSLCYSTIFSYLTRCWIIYSTRATTMHGMASLRYDEVMYSSPFVSFRARYYIPVFQFGLPQRWLVSWQLFEPQSLGFHANIFQPTNIKYYAWRKNLYDYPIALLSSLSKQTSF